MLFDKKRRFTLLPAGAVLHKISDFFQEEEESEADEGLWWLLGVLVGLVGALAVLLWWLNQESDRQRSLPGRREGASEGAREGRRRVRVYRMPPEPALQSAPVISDRSPAAEEKEPDDLKVIEGIGPKVCDLLESIGVTTFDELAHTEVSRLRQLLDESKWPMIDPSTWPEQARRAAAGDWEGLHKLQQELKAGRQDDQ